MNRIRVLVAACLLGSLLPTGVGVAHAGDVADPRLTALLGPAEVAGQPGRVADSWARVLGPAIPTSCQPPSGRMPSGREAGATLYREVDLSTGTMWQNSVFVYPSTQAARDSFARLRTQTAAVCRGQAFSPYGDDEEPVPNVVAAGWRPWSPASGRPGFTSATSVIVLDLASAPPGYTDLFAFEAFVLAGDAIVEVNVAARTPLGAGQRALARALADEVAGRYLGLPG